MSFYALVTLMGIHLAALAVPGPDALLILRTSLAYGYKQSVLASLGVGLGIVAWVILTALGLKTMFELFPILQILLMILSAFYLLYLGVMLAKSAKNPQNLEAEISKKASQDKRFFLIGLLTNLSNPKAILYFASVFSMFITKAEFGWEVGLLVVVISVESMVYFILLGRLFSTQKARVLFLKNQALIDGVCSAVFILFSFVIAYECFVFLRS